MGHLLLTYDICTCSILQSPRGLPMSLAVLNALYTLTTRLFIALETIENHQLFKI